jgi:hypothetical protein
MKKVGIFYDFGRGMAAQRSADELLAGELELVEDLVNRLIAAAAKVYELDEFTRDHGRYVPMLERLNVQVADAIRLRDHLRQVGRK